MKLFKLLFVAIIAFGMVACNNEDVPQIIDGPEATVSVKVFPSSKSPATRLAGDLTEESLGKGLAAESAIKNVEVWLFVGETPDGYGKGSDGEAFVEDVVTTAGPKTMVVAANANIGEVENKTELLEKFAETLSQDLTNGLVMTSEPVDMALIGGKNQYGYKTTDTESVYDAEANQISAGVRLPITRINARIALVGLTYEFTSPFYNKFELTEVALFNARKASNYFGTPLYKGNDFLYGSAYPSTLSTYVGSAGYTGTTYTAAADTSLAQVFTPNADPTAPALVNAKNAHYFYAFENSADTETDKVGTFIVLKGRLWNGEDQYIAPGLVTDADGYTYYAIWVNADNEMYEYGEHTPDGTIKRNTQYNISANLKKAGNPTIDPAVEAQLDVWVEVEPWVVVNQNVTW